MAMKIKLTQHRGQREILMKNVCATVERLLDCGRKLNQCLTTSEVRKMFYSELEYKHSLSKKYIFAIFLEHLFMASLRL